MTIEQVIKKAVEGGFDWFEFYDGTDLHIGMKDDAWIWASNADGEGEAYPLSEIFQCPRFWQSLGKAMEWQTNAPIFYEFPARNHVGAWIDESREASEWLIEWHRCIDHVAEGGTPESFFKKL